MPVLFARLMASCIAAPLLISLYGSPVVSDQSAKPARPRSIKPVVKPTDENFTAAMDKIRATWVQEFNAGHAEKVAALYAPEAVIMRWDGSMHGRDSIQALLQKSITHGAHDYVVHSLKSEHSGILGYESGAYNVTLRTRVVEGNYLIVLKNVNGHWWIVAHASTPNPQVR